MRKVPRSRLLTTVLAVGGGLTLSQTTLATGPIAYWVGDEASGTALINYGSLGTSANGTYNGPTLAQVAAPGGGLAPSFDGSNDFIELKTASLEAAIVGLTRYTFSVWAKVSDIAIWSAGGRRCPFSMLDQLYNVYGMLFEADGNFYLYAKYIPVVVPTTSLSDAWFNLVIAVDDGTVYGYLNGSLIDDATGDTKIEDEFGNVIEDIDIGYALDALDGYWSGSISHVAVWDKALTPTEIATIYAAGT